MSPILMRTKACAPQPILPSHAATSLQSLHSAAATLTHIFATDDKLTELLHKPSPELHSATNFCSIDAETSAKSPMDGPVSGRWILEPVQTHPVHVLVRRVLRRCQLSQMVQSQQVYVLQYTELEESERFSFWHSGSTAVLLSTQVIIPYNLGRTLRTWFSRWGHSCHSCSVTPVEIITIAQYDNISMRMSSKST